MRHAQLRQLLGLLVLTVMFTGCSSAIPTPPPTATLAPSPTPEVTAPTEQLPRISFGPGENSSFQQVDANPLAAQLQVEIINFNPLTDIISAKVIVAYLEEEGRIKTYVNNIDITATTDGRFSFSVTLDPSRRLILHSVEVVVTREGVEVDRSVSYLLIDAPEPAEKYIRP